MVSSTNGGIEKRIYMHWKSLKLASPLVFVVDKTCGWLHPPCESKDRFSYYPHCHGHYETSTSNDIWLRLARTHKMKVRAIKDIINAQRNK